MSDKATSGKTKTGATPINYPNTRAHPAEDYNTDSEHQEEDADNFNFGDLIRANSHSQSELAENILQPENIQVQIIEQAMASGITLQKLSDETSCVPPIWWNLFEQFKICNN